MFFSVDESFNFIFVINRTHLTNRLKQICIGFEFCSISLNKIFTQPSAGQRGIRNED